MTPRAKLIVRQALVNELSNLIIDASNDTEAFEAIANHLKNEHTKYRKAMYGEPKRTNNRIAETVAEYNEYEQDEEGNRLSCCGDILDEDVMICKTCKEHN